MAEYSKYLFFSIALVVYFFLHSYFSETGPKSAAQKRFSSSKFYYRLIYNLLSILGLIILAIYYFFLPNDLLLDRSPLFLTLGIALSLGGFAFSIKAIKSYNLSEFSGTYQMRTGEDYHAESLNTSGMNKYVRHPLYFSTLIFVFGLFLLILNVKFALLTIIVTLYLIVGTKNEEKKLLREFGDDYKKYQNEVPMLLPFIKWKKNKEK